MTDLAKTVLHQQKMLDKYKSLIIWIREQLKPDTCDDEDCPNSKCKIYHRLMKETI